VEKELIPGHYIPRVGGFLGIDEKRPILFLKAAWAQSENRLHKLTTSRYLISRSFLVEGYSNF
jgi:hypothetical protein